MPLRSSKNKKQLYEDLTHTVSTFISEINKAKLQKQIYDVWNIKDILTHVTFWHLNYAQNLESEDKGQKPNLSKGTIREISMKGVEGMRNLSVNTLVEKLLDANKRIGRVIEHGRVKKMTYKDMGRVYTIKELLHAVNSHINHHIRDIKRLSRK